MKEKFPKPTLINNSMIITTGLFYFLGFYLLGKNIISAITNFDFYYLVYVAISFVMWIVYGLVFIGTIKIFDEKNIILGEELFEQTLKTEQITWFFTQMYILVSFFIIFILWHSNVQEEMLGSGGFGIMFLFMSFVPFLIDALRVKKRYFILGISTLTAAIFLVSVGFFKKS